MGRPKRAADGGLIYHVLNRSNARMTICKKDEDYEALERILQEAVDRTATRLLAYCVLRNHWHLVVWPREDGELSKFTGWLTLTQRWHAHRHSTGSGHLYQGCFNSFPVQDDDHFFTVCRYVERNATSQLVARAEQWRWCSLHRWLYVSSAEKSVLAPRPLARRPGWVDHVNTPQTDAELAAIRQSVKRGCPFGDETWSGKRVKKLGLEITLRPQGRPKKHRI